MDNSDNPVFQLRVAPREKQNRWTVFFRLFLLIPQFVVLYGLLIGAGFLTFLGWFVAIFTGRNPFHDYVAGVLCWYARVICYTEMLTGKYPPFSMRTDGDYPIATHLEKGPLGRASVLFRLILVIPVAIVQWIISVGMFVLSIVAWIVTLILGQLPQSMHVGFQATIRFQFRVYAYIYLLQNRYPRGLFGDMVNFESVPTSPGASALEVGSVGYESVPSGLGETNEPITSPVTPTTGLTPAPTYVEASSPHSDSSAEFFSAWRLPMSKGGRWVLYTQFALGIICIVVQFSVPGHLTISNANQDPLWSTLYRSNVQSANSDILNSQSSMFAASPDWTLVKSECAQISSSLAQLERVPKYPNVNVDRHLLLGVSIIREAIQSCSTAGTSQSTPDLVGAANEFLVGSDLLQVFLNQSGAVFQF